MLGSSRERSNMFKSSSTHIPLLLDFRHTTRMHSRLEFGTFGTVPVFVLLTRNGIHSNYYCGSPQRWYAIHRIIHILFVPRLIACVQSSLSAVHKRITTGRKFHSISAKLDTLTIWWKRHKTKGVLGWPVR